MRALLDTNILIHREASTVVREDIGTLFRWLDRMRYEKCIHPLSIDEVAKHADPRVVQTLAAKLRSYSVLQTRARDDDKIATLRHQDSTPNDRIDTSLVAELYAGRVDLLITEDRGIHRKAAVLGIGANVFTIDSFLEKATAENPALADYRVLSVRRTHLGNIDVSDTFFDSFRADYPGFDRWFNNKADEQAYVCTTETGQLVAFLYVKREDPGENYSDIAPRFQPKRRLKIGTLKVISNGHKLGERFLKIVFDNARVQKALEIYVTMFVRTPEQVRLRELLRDWGFSEHGEKVGVAGTECVLVRRSDPHFDETDPRRCYPYVNGGAPKWIVPIYPAYHTELLPDSILNTESPAEFTENRPNRNAISKVYISRSYERSLRTGDIVVFYRTKSEDGPAHYTSVATTIGVVQEVIDGIPDEKAFIRVCRKRSVFSDEELLRHWNYSPSNRPFVVNFLFVHSFPSRPNLLRMKEMGILQNHPRGFEPLSDSGFRKLLEIAHADQGLVVD